MSFFNIFGQWCHWVYLFNHKKAVLWVKDIGFKTWMDGWRPPGHEPDLQYVRQSLGGTLSLSLSWGDAVIFLFFFSFQVNSLNLVFFLYGFYWRIRKGCSGFHSAQRLWLKAVRFPCRAEGNSLEAKDLGSHPNLVPISRRLPVMSLVTGSDSQEAYRMQSWDY